MTSTETIETPERPSDAAASRVRAIASRIEALDCVRGAVMVLMALDHIRDFTTSSTPSATDLTQATAALFLTRWITHFCAPTFVFLAGASAWLSLGRGRDPGRLARVLLTRGLWLVVVELTVVRYALLFNGTPRYLAGVIWVIGWSMVALAGLMWLPRRAVAIVAAAMIVGHNALDGVPAAAFGSSGWLWKLLHEPGVIPLGEHGTFWALYVIVPWVGVMAAGFLFGRTLERPRAERSRALIRTGAVLAIAFVGLRATNLYGDPAPWTPQPTAAFTFLSFVNCQKYPPSLLYLLMTLGPMLIALGWLDRRPALLQQVWGRVLIVFGRVPFFYYVVHLYVSHVVAILLALALGMPGGAHWLVTNAPFFTPTPPGYGIGLPAVYVVWAAIVAGLYPLCRWFAGVKRRRRDWWLAYL